MIGFQLRKLQCAFLRDKELFNFKYFFFVHTPFSLFSPVIHYSELSMACKQGLMVV